MEFFLISLLNGVSYGLLLFMLSAGLTLIFSMMGVLNFAHASFYMLGAYVGYSLNATWGFVPALVLAPLAVGLLGALFEKWFLRRAHAHGHVPELLITFGLACVLVEVVQLLWGRAAVPFAPPDWLQGPAFTLVGLLMVVLSAFHYFGVRNDIEDDTYDPPDRWVLLATLVLLALGSCVVYYVVQVPFDPALQVLVD